MPAEVERCVSSLLEKWSKDPASRPKPKEEGQDAKSQAFAICQAAYNKRVASSLDIMFEGGLGPAFIGAAATNRPYIPQLKETRVLEEDGGKKKLLVHLANSGHFNHPLAGPFILNRQVFSSFKTNFESNVIGQRAAYDCRHRPDDGAYGWFEKLMFGDEVGEGEKEFWGLVDPTEVGLQRIEGGQFRYSSMEFHLNYDRSDVSLDLENVTSDFCVIDLEEEEPEVNDMGDENTIALEEHQKALDKVAELEKRKADDAQAVKDAEERAQKAQALMLEMQQEALETSAKAVIELAQNRVDDDGNALPRQLVEWMSKVLMLEPIGEDDSAIKLSQDEEVGLGMRKYLIGAMKALVLAMPGSVPAERQTAGGQDNSDKFDYDKEWEE